MLPAYHVKGIAGKPKSTFEKEFRPFLQQKRRTDVNTKKDPKGYICRNSPYLLSKRTWNYLFAKSIGKHMSLQDTKNILGIFTKMSQI